MKITEDQFYKKKRVFIIWLKKGLIMIRIVINHSVEVERNLMNVVKTNLYKRKTKIKLFRFSRKIDLVYNTV